MIYGILGIVDVDLRVVLEFIFNRRGEYFRFKLNQSSVTLDYLS